jgi:Kelch motif
MRRLLAFGVALFVGSFALAALATVVDFPGESRLKAAIGYDDGSLVRCVKRDAVGRKVAWRVETPLPSVRDEARAVAVGDSIFIAGGISAPTSAVATSVATFERYDVVARRYERLPDLPLALDHAGIAAVDGAVYVFGGTRTEGPAVRAANRAFRYVIAARRWEELPRMRHPRGAHGFAVVGRTIYAIGGRVDRVYGGRPSVATVEAFDTQTQQWTETARVADARDHAGATAFDDQIYVVGGRDLHGNALARLDRYEPATNRWNRLPDPPFATSGISLTRVGDVLYAAGGESPSESSVMGEGWAYSPAEGRWRRLAPLPRPLHGYASAVARGRLYIIGGSTCPGYAPTRAVASLPVGLL